MPRGAVRYWFSWRRSASARGSGQAALPLAATELHRLWPTGDDGGRSPFHVVPSLVQQPEQQQHHQQGQWSTPVWVAELAACEDLARMNAGLVKLVHAVRASDPRGVTISNEGGYQSGKSHPRADHAAFIQDGVLAPEGGAARMLHAHIMRQVEAVVSVVGTLIVPDSFPSQPFPPTPARAPMPLALLAHHIAIMLGVPLSLWPRGAVGPRQEGSWHTVRIDDGIVGKCQPERSFQQLAQPRVGHLRWMLLCHIRI